MNIYIDESIHEEFGFMILAYVVCNQDPQSDIYKILSEHSVDEHHSCARMDKSESLRNLRSNLISYLNANCRWGHLLCQVSIAIVLMRMCLFY